MQRADVDTFNFYVPIVKSYQGDDGDWVVEGPLSSQTEDLEGDVMSSSGLLKGMETFHKLNGPVDWDHNYAKYGEPKFLIGKGVQTFVAPHPRAAEANAGEVPWLRSNLFKAKDVARQAVEHLNAGGDLGYSVYGGVVRREGAKIVEPVITMVSLTPMPVVAENAGCVRLVKSLAAQAQGREPPRPLPRVPELWRPELVERSEAGVQAFWKAMEATSALPACGPGVDACRVEDFAGGQTAGGKKKRKRRTREDVLKALAAALVMALRAHRGAE